MKNNFVIWSKYLIENSYLLLFGSKGSRSVSEKVVAGPAIAGFDFVPPLEAI